MKKILPLIMATVFGLLATTGADAKSPVKGTFTSKDGYSCKYNEERDGSKRGITLQCENKKTGDKFTCRYMEKEANLHNNQKCGYQKDAGKFYKKLAKKIKNKGKCGWGYVYINKCKEAPMFLRK